MNLLGVGLYQAQHLEEALSVREAAFSMARRLGGPAEHILTLQGNLANLYGQLGQKEQALRLRRDVYAGTLRLHGEEKEHTLIEANNYAMNLLDLRRFEEVKLFLRKMLPVAQRVLTDSHLITLKMRCCLAMALHDDPSATLDNFREAVTTLEDVGRIARRVLGVAHPVTEEIEGDLENARAELRAREAEAVRVAECDALQRDFDAIQARIAALNARKAEAIGKLTPPGNA